MKTYKAHIRIPTVQYGYIELEVDEPLEEIVNITQQINDLVEVHLNEPDGLKVNDWAKFRNNYLATGEVKNEELYAQMNKTQKKVINEIKLAIRSFKDAK
jgi:hypothetical protein